MKKIVSTTLQYFRSSLERPENLSVPAAGGVFLLFLLAAAGMTTLYTLATDTIPSWDEGVYWRMMISLRPLHPLSGFLEFIARSIRTDYYSVLPALVLIPFRFLWGTDWNVFLLSSALVYGTLSAVAFLVFAKRWNQQYPRADRCAIWIYPLLVLLTLPNYWELLWRGYVDAIGIPLIFIIWVIVMEAPWDRLPWRRVLVVGALCALLCLMRRWYATWVAGFGAVLFIVEGALPAITTRSWGPCLRAGGRVFLMGVSALGLFLLVSGPSTLRFGPGPSSAVYNVYRGFPWMFRFAGDWTEWFGLVVLVMAGAGMWISLRQGPHRRPAVLFPLQTVCSLYAYTRIQDMDSSHLYLILPPLMVFLMALFFEVDHRAQRGGRWAVVAAGLIGLCLVNALGGFVPAVGRWTTALHPLFPSRTFPPVVRKDLAEIARLSRTLDRLTRHHREEDYLLASTLVINTSLLENAPYALPFLGTALDRPRRQYDVDVRDGFPLRFVHARFVVVAEPIQLHLRPQDQRVVGLLAEQFLSRQGLAKAFRRRPETFRLDNGVTLSLFEKVRPFQKEELRETQDVFQRFYPDRPEMFSVPGA